MQHPIINGIVSGQPSPTSGPPKRSRGGCYTCKKRKKKCDEVFNANGHCGRCIQAKMECVLRPPPSASAPYGAPSSIGASSRASTSRAPHGPASSIPAQLPSVTFSAPYNSTPQPSPSPLAFSLPQASSSSHLPGYPSQAVPESHNATYAGSLFQHLNQDLHLPAARNPTITTVPETLYDIPDADELLAFFTSLDSAIQPERFDKVNDEGPGGSDREGSGGKGSTAGGAAASAWLGGMPLPQPPPAAMALANGASYQGTPSTPVVDHPSASSTGAARTPREERREDHEVARPVYEQLNDVWLSSFPKPIRELLSRDMTETALSSQLGESACLAVCLLYRSRMLDEGASEAREQLIKQSDAYFQDAVAQLEEATIPLEAQLLAVFDLSMHQLEQFGAAAAYTVLLLGDYFIHKALGPRPTLDLSNKSISSSKYILHAFAICDVFRGLLLPSRRPLFSLTCGTSFATWTPHDQDTGTADALYGLPSGLAVILAAILDHAMDRDSFTPSDFKRRTDQFEEEIKQWKIPATVPGKLAEEALKVIDDMITWEMWRQATLIVLYQKLRGLGSLAPCMRSALQQLLSLGARTTPPLLPPLPTPDGGGPFPSYSTTSERAIMFFIAGTVAINTEDRSLCREAIRRSSPQVLVASNLAALERIWAVTDETGRWVEWNKLLQEEGLSVMFV